MGHEEGTLGPDQVTQALVEEAAAPRDSPEIALSGAFVTSKDQLRARPRTHAQDRSEPSSLCARMRRASSSNFDGTRSSAGPTGNGSSAPSPTSCTGMLSASSRPFAISASTKDEVHNTETRSSLTRSSWHVGSSPRDFGLRAERTGSDPWAEVRVSCRCCAREGEGPDWLCLVNSRSSVRIKPPARDLPIRP
jgi:hypothetical protein